MSRPLSESPRPWIAGALSLIATGVGHLYAGAPKRGTAAWLATRMVALFAAGAVILFAGRAGLAGYAALSVGVLVMVARDAVRVVHQLPAGNGWRWYQRPASIIVACGIVWVGSIAWTMLVGSNIADRVRVDTDTMAPTLLKGDRLFVAPRRDVTIPRGELVVYKLWETRYVKRVVGVPGDTLAMLSGVLSVDGRSAFEPYAIHVDEGDLRDRRFDWQRAYALPPDSATYAPTLRTWGPLVVPRASYFVLGDNRGETVDSRYNGFVADSDVLGRPRTIYFSRDRATGRIRWDRIGMGVGGGRRGGETPPRK
jgi:signal peptidase I